MEDMDVDSDDEKQLKDIAQLNAALEEDDEPSVFLEPSASVSGMSRYSQSMPSTSTGETAQEHQRIDSALALNKLLDEKLRRLESILVNRLHECRQKLRDLHELAVSGDKQERQETFRYINCGKPYFKDKANFPAPDNEDTILMAKSNMYDFSDVTSVPGWTVKDKCSLTSLLLKISIEIKKKELTSKIAKLRREGKNRKAKALEKDIDAVNREITALGIKTLKDVALPLDEDYDWELVANKLNRRHTAAEYRSLWRVFLHPSINKNVWDKHEHARLQEIAQRHNLEDWDAIAKELNTDRTGFQCFVYYRTNMSSTFNGQKWTKEEEEYLRRLIEYYKEDEYIPWGKVASSMENRTKIQIYNKYFRLVEKRKGRFLPEEDAVILTCYDKFGPNYKKMSEYLPGRSATQIRVRYQVLAKKRISTVWTVQEDKQLLQVMANEEDRLTNYSTIAKHFPGKTRVQIRARHLTLVKWMKKHPNSTLDNAPRRGARRLGHGQATDNLNKATDKLKKRIESEIEIRKQKRITRESPLEVIEDAIIANLVTEIAKLEDERKVEVYDEDEVMVLDETIVSVLDLNVTNLQKMIILLRGTLKKDLFKASTYAEQYPGLLDPQQEVNLFQVKSYSRKSSTMPVVVAGAPDIWGNNTLGALTYVLPPHYATITGLRKLMTYVNCKTKIDPPGPSFNLNLLVRKNCMFKQQFFLLMDRFNTLFMFPMLLSNEGPEKVGKLTRAQPQRNNTTEKFNSHFIYVPASLSMPVQATPVKLDLPIQEDAIIDLEEPDQEQKDNLCVRKVAIDENAFRFVAEDDKYKKKKTRQYICTF